MTGDEAHGCACNLLQAAVRLFCDAGLLATSALTQAGRIRTGAPNSPQSLVVAGQEAFSLTSDGSVLAVALSCNRRLQTAAALTEAARIRLGPRRHRLCCLWLMPPSVAHGLTGHISIAPTARESSAATTATEARPIGVRAG